jgi:acetyltransferase
VVIRPLESADREALAFVHEHLSDQSLHQRFLGPRRPPSGGELQQLLRVDHWHHEALIAFGTGPRAPLGTARYARTDRFDTAEIAVEVIDARQRLGIGRALVSALTTRALAAGVRRFVVITLAENRAAQRLARQLGRPAAVSASGGTVEMLIELEPPRRR